MRMKQDLVQESPSPEAEPFSEGMLPLLALGASPSVYGTGRELAAGQQPRQPLS